MPGLGNAGGWQWDAGVGQCLDRAMGCLGQAMQGSGNAWIGPWDAWVRQCRGQAMGCQGKGVHSWFRKQTTP
eukprot:253502-Rhodomonas_salina.1